jgi:arylformamidase
MQDARPPLWTSLSEEEHEFQYNPQRAFPNFADYQAQRAPANAAARANLTSHLDIPYGDHPLRRVDVYPAAASADRAPVHVFFHGGYWRAQDKENFAFVAKALVARGVTTVVANYELCPASTLDGVVDSALAAVAWTCRAIAEFGADPTRITLSGHSAGAHLCAEVLAADWRSRGVDPACFRGAVLISGIFDPEPAIRTTVNAQLNLDPEIASRHNLEVRPPLVDCPAWILAGGREPWLWIDQSYRYAHHLHRHGRDPEVHVLPGWNHFDIVAQYMDEGSPILRAALEAALGKEGRS